MKKSKTSIDTYTAWAKSFPKGTIVEILQSETVFVAVAKPLVVNFAYRYESKKKT